MRFVSFSLLAGVLTALFVAPLHAQQAPDAFRWIDFHSAADQNVLTWVTRSLTVENWTSIREIGVEYDAALVVTTSRSNPQSLPAADTFTVWSLSLTNHSYVPLIKGVNLHLLDWLLFDDGHPRELAALYDDCADCQPSTYFTAFHYDMEHHAWAARWMRGNNQAILVWSANLPQGVALTQLYAMLTQPNGRSMMCTWNHIDHGQQKPEDIVACYDLDPLTSQERTQLFTRTPAQPIKQRICGAQNPLPGLMRGQDSPLCQQMLKARPERKPVTTPPANNHGHSQPPRARR